MKNAIIQVKINLIDQDVMRVLKTVTESGMCALIHRHDIKVYVAQAKKLYVLDEEQLTFSIHDPEKIDQLIDVIKGATNDKFLELMVTDEIADDQTLSLVRHEINEEALADLLTDAKVVRGL